jgi:hypothetical protein
LGTNLLNVVRVFSFDLSVFLIDLTGCIIQVKENFRSDPRYKAVKHEERENAFNEYIAELKSAEREVEQAAKAKVDEQVS